MPRHPLAEVFGFPADNHSQDAERYRRDRLCPYNNRVANCTKDKANDPLGVCSILEDDGSIAITCPVRFRQNWRIADDAAAFFFSPGTAWTSLSEVRLSNAFGKSAGNIDLVLAAYDDQGQVIDFGAVEIQSVYISGNIRHAFEHYMQNPSGNARMDWTKQPNYPRPDYLSSSRKRLAPQLVYKGGILNSWGKKLAVVLNRNFFNTLPALSEAEFQEAEIAWLIYDLVLDQEQNRYQLELQRTVYTHFETALAQIATPEPGPIDQFMNLLQEKLDQKRSNGTSMDSL